MIRKDLGVLRQVSARCCRHTRPRASAQRCCALTGQRRGMLASLRQGRRGRLLQAWELHGCIISCRAAGLWGPAASAQASASAEKREKAAAEVGMMQGLPGVGLWVSLQQRNESLHWGLNPGPSVYRTDALPLSYRGLNGTEGSGCSLPKMLVAMPAHKGTHIGPAMLRLNRSAPGHACITAAAAQWAPFFKPWGAAPTHHLVSCCGSLGARSFCPGLRPPR